MEEREHFSRRVGTTIRDKWHLDALLGVGGMAAVYAATHKIGRREALKILHPEIARNKDLRVRFEREARAVNQFQHPGVVEIRDIDVTEDGAPFLVMEFLEGENLADLAKRQNGIETGEMLRIMDDLLDVLVAAHARNIVHRDIKLDNLFLLTDSRLKVLDFGIARMRTDRDIVTRTGATLGTVAYMPPEQVKGLEIDARADLFAVGATMFRLVARRRIHDARSEAEMLVKMATEPAPALLEVAPDASRGLAQVVDRALAFERERRYPDALTMQGDVRALREGREPPYAAGRLAAGDDPRDKRPIEGSGLANVAAGLGGAAGVAPPSTAGPSSVVAMEPTSLGEPSGPPSYAGSPMSLGDPTVASTPSAIGSSPPTSVGAAMGLAESPAPPSIESGPIASGPIASGPVGSGPVGSGPVGFAPAATLPGAALTAAPSSRGGGATPWIAAALAGAVLVGAVFGLWMVMGDDASAEDAEVATDDGDDDDDDDDDRARGAAGEDDETEGSGRSRGLPSALRGEPGPGVERPGTEPGPGDPDAPRPGGLVPPPPPDPADPPPAKRGDPPPPPPPAAPSKTASPRDPPPPKAPSPKPEDDKKSTGKPDKREGDGKGKGKGKKK